jgi:hypothetical protein
MGPSTGLMMSSAARGMDRNQIVGWRFRPGCSTGRHAAIGAPAWRELPAEARAALTSLMTRLILDHAATTAAPPAKEDGHDL